MKKALLTISLITTLLAAKSQETVYPAGKQSAPILITNATVHVGNGQVLNNSSVLITNGKITQVGAAITAPAGAETINGQGKHVYPGLILTASDLGLVEVPSVRATSDVREIGDLNPSVRSLVAYNTDSKVTNTLRANGILLANIVPDGGLVSGSSSIVQLDAWNWEDAAYKTYMAIHLNWPVSRSGGRNGATGTVGAAPQESPDEAKFKTLDAINNLFGEAKAYAETKPAVKNLRLEAMKGLFNGNKKLFIVADGAREIIEAVTFSKKLGIDAVIVGGSESYLVTNVLKQNNIPVILRETQTLPSRDEDDVYLTYKLPKILQDAGVLYGLTGTGFWRQRNLPFEAGQAVGHGLTREQALSMITINNARILGIDKTTGTLEVGKDANLFISTGDALDAISINVEKAFIQGRDINLDNLHKQLYKRYSDKYEKN